MPAAVAFGEVGSNAHPGAALGAVQARGRVLEASSPVEVSRLRSTLGQWSRRRRVAHRVADGETDEEGLAAPVRGDGASDGVAGGEVELEGVGSVAASGGVVGAVCGSGGRKAGGV